MKLLERIARDPSDTRTAPRPTGSAANAACRARIVAEFERIGLEPEVQEEFGVNVEQGATGVVRNIVARLRGSEGLRGEGRAILCMAHYDSVAAGPGISDDLAGVAAWLEVARALRAGDLPGRDVIFLIADGEELGLLGAETFASEHPWASDVGVVLNLEGRGSTGPSRMFETAPENAWAIEAFAEHASRPSATSLSVEVYRRMPNLTDFKVWLRRGVQGLNFAFIGNPAVYHTPLDDFENLSPGTLQHHVTNGLDAVRAMDAARFPGERDGRAGAATRGDAVYFDVAGRWVARCSYSTARIAVFVALFLAALVSTMIALRRPTRLTRVIVAILALAVSLAASLALGVCARWMLGVIGVAPAPWIAHAAPVVCAVILAAGAMAFALFSVAGRIVNAHEASVAVLGVLCAAAIACTFEFTGIVYVVLVPLLVYALSLGAVLVVPFWTKSPRAIALSTLPAFVGVGIVWTPLHAALIDAFGTASGLVIAGPLVVGIAILFPVVVAGSALMAGQVALTAALLGLVSGVFAAFLPAATATRPTALSFIQRQTMIEGTARAHVAWEAKARGDAFERWEGAATADVRRAFEDTYETEVEPPTIEVLQRGSLGPTTVYAKVRLRSSRRADLLEVRPRGVSDVILGGESLGGGPFRILGPSAEGEVLTLVASSHGMRRAVLRVDDVRFGLGSASGAGEAELIQESRDETMTPARMGDYSVLEANLLVEMSAN